MTLNDLMEVVSGPQQYFLLVTHLTQETLRWLNVNKANYELMSLYLSWEFNTAGKIGHF